jgi:lipopolysaccharide transport system ATP-binding protein
VSSPLIALEGIGKDYPLVSSGAGRFRTLFSLLAGRGVVDYVSALDAIDLDVHRGESLGLVGENGAGKSTLLKVIAGVVRPTRGVARVQGRVGALLELGSGFHPDYTGRENIGLSAALAGLSREELRGREDGIIAFADIGSHIDQPVKHYSSGMVVRLGFAIATALRPDVLITDEVLAVGDESFQRKCIQWIRNYLDDGGTLLLCSHSLYHVQTLCKKAAWLQGGRMRAYGDSFTVTQDYLAYHEERRRKEESSIGRRAVSGELFAVRSMALYGRDGVEATAFEMHDTISVRLELHSPDDRPPVALIGIVRADGSPVFGTHSNEHGYSPAHVAPHQYAFGLRFPRCSLLPGKYLLRGHAMDPEGLRLFDTVEIAFMMRGVSRDYGLVRLEHEWHALAR